MHMSRGDTYYLYLYDSEERTAMTPFEAPSDLDAARIATAVFQACGDCCDGFEVRRNAHYVAGMTRAAPRRPLNLDELATRTQMSVVETEERLLASQTRVALSRQLLERTKNVKRKIGTG